MLFVNRVSLEINAMRDPTDYRSHLLQMIEWIALGTLKPVVTASYPLMRTVDAFDSLPESRICGKAVLMA